MIVKPRISRFFRTGMRFIFLVPAAALLLACVESAALAQRTVIKPGRNMFSPEDDIQLGKEASAEIEKQVQLLNDRRVDDYLTRLGLKLSKVAPGHKFPYQFKGVNDLSINAFALPGGHLYINRGTIEAADNEAQLAGVVGHEIGHAALRHGTNQLTKAQLAEGLLGILGGVVGSGSWKGAVTQIGAGFFANSVLLKYSRDAERQADIIGTQILYDNSYDPRAMAQFFDKLAAETQGSRAPEWFSSHPHPENRAAKVNDEIAKMGGDRSPYTNDSAEFQEVQRYIRNLPQPVQKPKAAESSQPAGGAPVRPQPPSTKMKSYQGTTLRLNHPDNWNTYGQQDSFTLAPEGGIIDDGRGNASVAYGLISGVYSPQMQSGKQPTLWQATNQLMNEMRKSNPAMSVRGSGSRTRVGGKDAILMSADNDSPIGGKEEIRILTVFRSEGLRYFLFVAPAADYEAYQKTFESMVASIAFSGK